MQGAGGLVGWWAASCGGVFGEAMGHACSRPADPYELCIAGTRTDGWVVRAMSASAARASVLGTIIRRHAVSTDRGSYGDKKRGTVTDGAHRGQGAHQPRSDTW